MIKYPLFLACCFVLFIGCNSEKTKVASVNATTKASTEVAVEARTVANTSVEVQASNDINTNTTIEKIASETTKVGDASSTIPAKAKDVESTLKEVKKEKKQKEKEIKNEKPSVADKVEVNSKTEESFAKAKEKVEKPAAKEKPIVEKETVGEQTKKEAPASKTSDAISHEAFNKLLSTYVSGDGKVDYAGLKSEVAVLDTYLSQISSGSQDNWSKSKELAYWINAYNGYTIKLILDNYPLKSITDLYGGKPWDKKWIEIGGKTYSLNNIENDIIRPTFNEPRIHFAVNCAAKSCPKLGNFAFTEANLEEKLEKNTKKFINGPENKITADQASISKIFEWYKADFGDLKKFLNKYSDTKIAEGTELKYSEYDWQLNGK